ncbi:threonine-phosphate decarboxylase CobD [Undibacterium sp. RuRC25W]|uniref:threonine-phosphate decarboxylase CobD n=1 Tax=Undibacterium sp. RuRC25W TaxID=3413047 RepID=UPI003BF26824
MLEHGGNLRDAVNNFKRPLDQWLDLSTGINPRFYPAPSIADNAWHRLPEHSDELIAAAMTYYGAPEMLAVAGTQAAIQSLPHLRHALSGHSKVLVSAPSYAEHAHQWRRGGHQVTDCIYPLLEAAIDQADVVVLCNPNNPTGEMVEPETLLTWAARLAQRGGWLVVDEAFGDTVPALSVASHTKQPGLIVLRSVGKFFGLAGIRLGFVAAQSELLQRLGAMLGPWTVSGPAQQIAIAAFGDVAWQADTRHYLQQQGQRLRDLLSDASISSSGTDLFQWSSHRDLEGRTELLWHFMAERGIWLRWFAQAPFRPHGVRFGLPGTEVGWQRLNHALNEWTQQYA